MYLDFLSDQITSMPFSNKLEVGATEAVSNIFWVTPHLYLEVKELKVISELLASRYGQKYAFDCQNGNVDTINPKLKDKFAVERPPKHLVESYLIEIAKTYGYTYLSDCENGTSHTAAEIPDLITLADENKDELVELPDVPLTQKLDVTTEDLMKRFERLKNSWMIFWMKINIE